MGLAVSRWLESLSAMVMFALQEKAGWFKYFEPFGITNPDTIGQLLVLVGIIDIALAILILIKPVRIALLWMTFWGFWTALIRPIVGEPICDFGTLRQYRCSVGIASLSWLA